jgi:ribosomal protein S13
MKIVLFLVLALLSLQAFAQRMEVGHDSKTIVVTDSTRNVNIDFNIPVYRYEYRTQTVRTTCYRTKCTSQEGNGSKGDWKNFFNVPKEQKATALAGAIKGIGKATADKIVDNNLLTSKPDSWSLFVKEMNRIENKLQSMGYRNTWAREVTEVYGYDNRVSLGYASAESCTKEPYDCYIDQVVEVKTRMADISRNLEVAVHNQTLQTFEQDEVTVTVGDNNNDVQVSSAGFNNYAASIFNRGGMLDLNGTRVLRPFPVKEVTASVSKEVNGPSKTLNVSVYVPKKFFTEDTGASLTMTIEVCKAGFLGLGCKSMGIFPIQNVGEVSMNKYTISGTGSYFARVKFVKNGSQYYSAGESQEKESNSVKF